MNKLKKILFVCTIAIIVVSCKFYTFTGASIAPEVKTFSVQTFLNVATMVAPILSSTLTDELVDKFTRQTSLSPVRLNGDFAFEGEIINYTSMPAAITGNEYAALNRLTITIKVKFTNKYDAKASFNSTFSRFADYDSGQPLQSVEQSLIPQIAEELVTDIFNASASNW